MRQTIARTGARARSDEARRRSYSADLRLGANGRTARTDIRGNGAHPPRRRRLSDRACDGRKAENRMRRLRRDHVRSRCWTSGIARSGVCAAIAWSVSACGKNETPETRPVVVYVSVDEPFARPVLEVFRAQTGIPISAIFDSEAGKTTGLVNRIVAEGKAGRVRGDVFWSGEVFRTIRLAREGLLASSSPATADDVPDAYKDSRGYWTGISLRARALAYDAARTAREEVPRRWEDLAEGDIAKDLAMGNPLFGTTGGQVAAMFALWGPDRGRSFLSRLRDSGVVVVDGNSAAVRTVLDGRARFAMTDSDDVLTARKVRPTLHAVYPDLGDGGTLLIPCSVALLGDGPNPGGGRRLVEFLVSSDVERMMARSEAEFIPVRGWLREELGETLPPASAVSLEAVADQMDEATKAVREILVR